MIKILMFTFLLSLCLEGCIDHAEWEVNKSAWESNKTQTHESK